MYTLHFCRKWGIKCTEELGVNYRLAYCFTEDSSTVEKQTQNKTPKNVLRLIFISYGSLVSCGLMVVMGIDGALISLN